jgi:hypothetical protein
MRIKLSEKYQNERGDICNKIITILELKEDNTFLLYELDDNIEKQNKILELKEEIQKFDYVEGNEERQSFISPRLATLYLTTKGKSFSR